MTEQERKHISEHFTLYEMTRSGMAIEHDLPNVPNLKHEQALRDLAINILEPLRHHFGPIIVSSGFRTQAVNKLVGGVPSSQHTRGEAVDIVVGNDDRALRLYSYVKNHLDFDQLILEPIGTEHPRWLHVRYTTRRRNRREEI